MYITVTRVRGNHKNFAVSNIGRISSWVKRTAVVHSDYQLLCFWKRDWFIILFYTTLGYISDGVQRQKIPTHYSSTVLTRRHPASFYHFSPRRSADRKSLFTTPHYRPYGIMHILRFVRSYVRNDFKTWHPALWHNASAIIPAYRSEPSEKTLN